MRCGVVLSRSSPAFHSSGHAWSLAVPYLLFDLYYVIFIFLCYLINILLKIGTSGLPLLLQLEPVVTNGGSSAGFKTNAVIVFCFVIFVFGKLVKFGLGRQMLNYSHFSWVKGCNGELQDES